MANIIKFGGAVPSGNAVAGDLLSGKTASVDAGDITGTMPNIGARDFAPTTVHQAIPAGYHNGSGLVYGDPDLVSANIKAGANIFGVAGNANVVDTSPGDAIAANLLSGKKAYVDGAQVVGSMPDFSNLWGQSTTVYTDGLGNIYLYPPKGYYDGSRGVRYAGGVTFLDPDFIPANFLSTANIFGMQGSIPTKGSFNVSNGSDGASQANRIFMRPTQGYYDGSTNWTYTDHAGFVAGNIKKGANIFGLVGTYEPKFPSKVKFVQPGAAGTYIYNFGEPVIASLIRFLGSGGANASYDCKVEGSNDALNSNIVVLYNANLAGWGSQNYAYANLPGAYQWYRVTVTVVATQTYCAHCFVLIPNGSVELG